jgi:hypothetical protein
MTPHALELAQITKVSIPVQVVVGLLADEPLGITVSIEQLVDEPREFF